MRTLLLAVLLWSGVLHAEGVAPVELRYPQDFFVVYETEPDLRVELRGDADGAVLHARVLSSKRPELDEAVTQALRGWRFRPDRQKGKTVEWTRELGFSFAGLQPADTPARLKDESPFFYPPGKDWTGADPEVVLEAVVAADGEVKSVRVLEAQNPELAQSAVQIALRRGHLCEPAERDGRRVASLLRLPVVFTRLPEPVKPVMPIYPLELRRSGNQGEVSVSYTITEQGLVKEIQVLKSAHPALEEAVVAALRQGQFRPMVRRGKPISGRVSQSFPFVLEGSATTFISGDAPEPYAIGGGLDFPEGLPEEFRYDQPPKVRVTVAAVYPFELLSESIPGSAKVNLVIGPDGRVHEARVLGASHPLFGAAARAAMEAWEFEPARKNGKPGWALISREIRFSRYERDAPDESALRLLKQLKQQSAIPTLADLDVLPAAVHQPSPVYPAALREAGVSGTVMVEFYIDRDGRTQLPRALQATDEGLAWAAVTAVSRWQFEPPLRKGQPVDVRAQVPVEFGPAAASLPSDKTATGP